MHISTDLREDYVWSESEEDWIFVNSNDSEFTFFNFNEEQKCEFDDMDFEDSASNIKINLYPNVRAYVDDGKIVVDNSKKEYPSACRSCLTLRPNRIRFGICLLFIIHKLTNSF